MLTHQEAACSLWRDGAVFLVLKLVIKMTTGIAALTTAAYLGLVFIKITSDFYNETFTTEEPFYETKLNYLKYATASGLSLAALHTIGYLYKRQIISHLRNLNLDSPQQQRLEHLLKQINPSHS